MTYRPRLVVEACAGTAAFSWWLVGARFPVSRQGGKRGYAEAVANLLGMRQHESAPDAYLLIEPEEELARTLALLTTPGGPAAVAEVIRSWIPCPAGHVAGGSEYCDECVTDFDFPGESVRTSTGKQDARRLWERLRRERPERSPEREAQHLTLQRGSNSSLPVRWVERHGHFDNSKLRGYADADDGRGTVTMGGMVARLDALPGARLLMLQASNRLIVGAVRPDGEWRNTGQGGTTHGGAEFADSAEEVAGRVEEAARYTMLGVQSYKQGVPASGFVGPDDRRQDTTATATATATARLAVPMPPTSVLCASCVDVDPAEVLAAYGVAGEDVLVLADPPYLGRCDEAGTPIDGATTGYLCELSRADLRRAVAAWDAVGATVLVHECAPLDEELGRVTGSRWWCEDISDARIGQARSFSTARGRTEIVTLNREPRPRATWPARDALPGQIGLFG